MQTEISDYQDRFGTDHLPYDVPHQTGSEGPARTDHREFYWTVFDRDDYECPDCGRGIDEVQRFEVHHLDRDPLNGRLWNLIAVCKRCHTWRHGTDPDMSAWTLEEWKAGFTDPDFHPVG